MGHFTIDLPETKKGDARWGIVSNLQFPLICKKKFESKQGYLVNVSDTDGKIEFRLFKSKNGEWTKDPEGKIGLNNETLIFIKNAIIEKELKDV